MMTQSATLQRGFKKQQPKETAVCPFDARHTYNSFRMFHHLRRCTQIRDIAYQCSLPFFSPTCTHSYNSTALQSYVGAKSNRFGTSCMCESTSNSPARRAYLYSKLWKERIQTAFDTCCRFLGQEPQHLLDASLLDSETAAQNGRYERIVTETFANPKMRLGTGSGNADSTVGTSASDVEPTVNGFSVANKFVFLSAIYAATKETVMKRVKGAHQTVSSPASFTKQQEDSGVVPQTTCDSKHRDISLCYAIHPAVKFFLSLKETCTLLPCLNRDEIQNLCILAVCLSFGLLNVDFDIDELLILECGGGKGSLARWFSYALKACKSWSQLKSHQSGTEFESSAYMKEENFCKYVGTLSERNEDKAMPRILIIEKEARRNKREHKDLELKDDKKVKIVSLLRLKLDLINFNLGNLLQYTNAADQAMLHRQFIPEFIKKLHSLGVKLDADLLDPVSVGQLVAAMGKGGGPCLESIENCFLQNYLGKPISWIILAAKHLCGSGADIALQSFVRTLDEVKSVSRSNYLVIPDVYITIASCCHHRCSIENFAGLEYITQELGFTLEDFSLLQSTSSFATGSENGRKLVGFQAKRIMDAARVWWLREHGFYNATLIKFAPATASLENIMIVASKFASE